MALITCPHCGSRNISDYQSICPNCGESLSNFIDYKNANSFQAEKNERNAARLRDEADKNRLRNERLNAAKRSLLPALKKELAEIDGMSIPDKPRFLHALFDKGGGARISIYLFFAFIVVTAFLVSVSKPIFIFSSAAALGLGIFTLITAIKDYRRKLDEYYYITDDFDYYKEELKNQVRKKYNEKAENMAVHNSPDKPDFISNWS